MKQWLVSLLITILFRLLKITWRIQEEALPEAAIKSLESGKTLSYAHWHGDEWPLLGAYAGRKMGVLVSDSKDGALMARFLEREGFIVARGSSSRGAVKGFLGLVRRLKRLSLSHVSLAVDGPRGPRHEPKAGIVALAQLLGGGLVLASVACNRAWVFSKSWNKAILPKPFAKIVICYSYMQHNEIASKELSEDEKLTAIKTRIHEGELRAESLISRRNS